MSSLKHRSRALLIGTVLAFACGAPALADDTEIFLGQNNSGVKPNILFILDTSGSMDTDVVTENAPYDPAVTYGGSCRSDRTYWVRDDGTPILPPTCEAATWFNATNMKCKTAKDAFLVAGFYSATRAAQFSTTNSRWEQIRSTVTNLDVECRADAGIDGDGVNLTRLWARDSSAKWTSNSNNQITWNANNTNRNYIFYSYNYLNWYNNPSTFTSKSRLETVQEVASNLLTNLTGVNVGLMRYSNNNNNGCDDGTSAEGGMVTFAVSDIDAGTNRTNVINTVKSYNASGCTPLSETLYEANQYFRGQVWDYGKNAMSKPGTSSPSVAASRLADGKTYKTPMQYSCQKNYIVYLTDGEPTADTSADAKIEGLPDFKTVVGASCDGTGDGHCLDDLAQYMYKEDLQPNMPGNQNVTSYWIGFGPDVTGSKLLQTTATRGGGQFYNADNTVGLTAVLSSIVTEILRTNTTFTAPSVSVNAFNRTQTLSDLYVSVFRPDRTYRWPGNVKKYRVTNGDIVDADGKKAVDPNTGFFTDTARSYWSASPDGADVAAGGAAHREPIPTKRNLYTNIEAGNNNLWTGNDVISVTNPLITDAVLGVGVAGQPTHDDLINWALGQDVQDADLDSDTTEPRQDMGDPLHAKPAVVIYGGSAGSPNIDDAVIYTPTNDGYLHAFDAVTGNELWAYIPFDQLDDIRGIYKNTTVNTKHYALDAEVRVLKYDVNQNGIVEPAQGDKVFLFFGQGRGGSNYYALDVTVKDQPKMLWTLGPAQLPGIGQTWSAPIVTRVNVQGVTQNSQKLVLVFAGGYDDTQDTYTQNTDTIGNSIYMVDLLTGSLLWRGSQTAGNQTFAKMQYSIPSNLALLDLDGDTFADRIYVGDTGGQLWRFDINNGNAQNALLAGGVIADLGAAQMTAPQPMASTRRFYSAPDVALIHRRGRPTFFNVALGSGYRGHPLNNQVQDRFYSIRDYNALNKFATQALFDAAMTAYGVTTDTNVDNITDQVSPTIADNSRGWKLELRLPGGYVGEKVLAESRTFNNKIFFPTYIPSSAAAADPCAPIGGSNRAYIVDVIDGSPVIDQDGTTTDSNGDGIPDLTLADRYSVLRQGGIAPEIAFLFPGRDPNNPNNPPIDPNNPPNPNAPEQSMQGQDPVVCLSGAEVLNACVGFNARIKTFWRESDAN
ncbi:MAG TPA: PilC/PilY family type IV pilus protein [Steroidobacteraceae bacterium]|nr:PilC/PilY family type IV pilus protein [Steroidobacteraceae bacterium]